MKQYTLTGTDGRLTLPCTEFRAQAYMNQFGAFEGKKPRPQHEAFLLRYLSGGKEDMKELDRRIKDSVKEIKKAFKSMKPKKVHTELPDMDYTEWHSTLKN